MRTNIDIDDDVMEKTIKQTGEPTKKAAVNTALREYLRIQSQAKVRELRGKIKWEGNLDEMRGGKVRH